MSPANEPMICFSPSNTTFTMNAKFAVRAAYNISSWIGLWSKLPVRDLSESIKSPLWLAIIVLYEATPGRTDLRPPENPAKKWLSINPSAINKSASAAIRLMMQSPPEGN